LGGQDILNPTMPVAPSQFIRGEALTERNAVMPIERYNEYRLLCNYTDIIYYRMLAPVYMDTGTWLNSAYGNAV